MGALPLPSLFLSSLLSSSFLLPLPPFFYPYPPLSLLFRAGGPGASGLLMNSIPCLCLARLGLTSSPGCPNPAALVFRMLGSQVCTTAPNPVLLLEPQACPPALSPRCTLPLSGLCLYRTMYLDSFLFLLWASLGQLPCSSLSFQGPGYPNNSVCLAITTQ